MPRYQAIVTSQWWRNEEGDADPVLMAEKQERVNVRAKSREEAEDLIIERIMDGFYVDDPSTAHISLWEK